MWLRAYFARLLQLILSNSNFSSTLSPFTLRYGLIADKSILAASLEAA